MRKRTLLYAFVAVCILCVIFIGCSDDNGTDPELADLNDPSYKIASLVLNNSDFESCYSIAIINFNRIAKWGQSSDYVYDMINGFCYSQLEVDVDTIYSPDNPTVIINTIPTTVRDSIRFWHGGTWTHNPDSAQLTRIEAGLSVRAVADSSIDSVLYSHIINITGAAGEIWKSDGNVSLAGGGTVVSAVTSVNYPDDDSPDLDSLGVCKVISTITSSYSGVSLNMGDWASGCPIGGGVTRTGPVSIEYCPGESGDMEFPATWTQLRTYNGDNITTKTNSPTREWSENQTCADL